MRLKIEEILKMASGVKAKMKANMPLINHEVNSIIKTKETSEQRIEHLLDMLLDYMQLGVGETEFKRLNAYYASINKENAKDYNRFYQELVSN